MHDCLAIPNNAARRACPRDGLWNNITNKWTIQVIATLAEAGSSAVRFGELRGRIHNISAKVLAATLHKLERDGLVSRRSFAGYPSHVEYQLTRVGAGLLPALDGLMRWMTDSWHEVRLARTAFDAGHSGYREHPPGERR